MQEREAKITSKVDNEGRGKRLWAKAPEALSGLEEADTGMRFAAGGRWPPSKLLGLGVDTLPDVVGLQGGRPQRAGSAKGGMGGLKRARAPRYRGLLGKEIVVRWRAPGATILAQRQHSMFAVTELPYARINNSLLSKPTITFLTFHTWSH